MALRRCVWMHCSTTGTRWAGVMPSIVSSLPRARGRRAGAGQHARCTVVPGTSAHVFHNLSSMPPHRDRLAELRRRLPEEQAAALQRATSSAFVTFASRRAQVAGGGRRRIHLRRQWACAVDDELMCGLRSSCSAVL